MPELKKLDLDVTTTGKTATTLSTPLPTPIAKPTMTPPITPSPAIKIALPLIAVFFGISTGYITANYLTTGQLAPTQISSEIPTGGVKVGDVIGVPDAKTFRDSAEGVIEKGGLSGEGSHSLLRPGGPSQTVYLTSSVIDLDEVVGHKAKVWGETFKGQKAGWLMDVGRIEILELDAPKPE